MKKTKEFRASRRRGCEVPVDSRLEHPGRMRAVDISRKGIGLISNRALTVDEDVAVKMDLSPDGESVVVWGKVSWVQRIPGSGNYRLGIRFTEDVLSGSRRRFKNHF